MLSWRFFNSPWMSARWVRNIWSNRGIPRRRNKSTKNRPYWNSKWHIIEKLWFTFYPHLFNKFLLIYWQNFHKFTWQCALHVRYFTPATYLVHEVEQSSWKCPTKSQLGNSQQPTLWQSVCQCTLIFLSGNAQQTHNWKKNVSLIVYTINFCVW